MTHVDDLYEANDWEPDEDERWAPGVVPVDLEEVEKRIERLSFLVPPPGLKLTSVTLPGAEDLKDLRELVGHDAPGLLADLREARRRIAEFEALPTRERWTVTSGLDVPPRSVVLEYADREAAGRYGNGGKQVWRRRLTVHPWEPVDSSPPF